LFFGSTLSWFAFSGQVADRTRNYGNSMTPFYQVLGDFMVPGAARFVNGSKSLVDEKDMHNSGCVPWLNYETWGNSHSEVNFNGSPESISTASDKAGILYPYVGDTQPETGETVPEPWTSSPARIS
jgi:hypothetical protein